MNLSFKEKGKSILTMEINWNVIDEMRKERKILMVLQDLKVGEYISMDMPDLDIYNEAVVKEQNPELQLCIQEKLEWRANFDYRVSIVKLDYILRVLRIYWEGK